jgi:hypothetical protein
MLEGLAIVVRDHDASVQRETSAPGAKPIAAAHRVGGGRRTPGRCGLGLDLREQIRRQIDVVGVVRRAGLVREPARDPAERACLPAAVMCTALKVSASGFYAWLRSCGPG